MTIIIMNVYGDWVVKVKEMCSIGSNQRGYRYHFVPHNKNDTAIEN